MLVEKWMSKTVITIDEDASMSQATRLMKENGIRMLPVLKKNRLTGVVTDRDLKRASASDATTLEIHELLYLLQKIKVRSIMTKHPVTVPPDLTVEETAEILLDKKISGVPVTNGDGHVVGVITQTDIFRVLISLTGVGKKGIQYAFRTKDRPGSVRELADIIRQYGGRMASILTSYDNAEPGYRNVYIRVYDLDRSRLKGLVEEFDRTAYLLYAVDHRENKRMMYQSD